MKRALSIILCLIIAINVLYIIPASAVTSETVTIGASSGTTRDCTWTLDDNGTLIISGNGAMEDYFIENQYYAPFMSLSIKNVIIENGVTHIGNGAFYACKNLISITIPNSVISIGDYAFSSCSSLSEIVIPNSVSIIGKEAFSYCRKLSDIEISDSITVLDYRVFHETAWYNSQPNGMVYLDKIAYAYKCDNYDSCPESLTIKDGTVLIAGGAFGDCYKLTDIIIPNTVKTIGSYAFSCCTGFTDITIPESVTEIGNHAFSECISLTNIIIPRSVVSIEMGAFSGCTDLASITISESVKTIESLAFCDCNKLKSVTLPASINNIGNYAFGYFEDFYAMEMVKNNSFTIYGYEGTEAEKYAKANGFTFHSTSENINPTLPAEPTIPTMPEYTEPTIPNTPEIIQLLGDVDSDKAVTIIDATYIQRSIASIPIPFELDSYVADTDGDGIVTILDATYIQRWLANLKSNERIGTNLIQRVDYYQEWYVSKPLKV